MGLVFLSKVPSYVPGYRIFYDCFLFFCSLESSCLGRLSAIKVQLELEFNSLFNITMAINTSRGNATHGISHAMTVS